MQHNLAHQAKVLTGVTSLASLSHTITPSPGFVSRPIPLPLQLTQPSPRELNTASGIIQFASSMPFGALPDFPGSSGQTSFGALKHPHALSAEHIIVCPPQHTAFTSLSFHFIFTSSSSHQKMQPSAIPLISSQHLPSFSSE